MPRDVFISRARIEPETDEGLTALFEYLISQKPDGLGVKPPEDHHTACYVYFQPFLARSAYRAESQTSFQLNRKLLKKSGVDFKRISIEVLRVKLGDTWPEDWFDEESIERLGADTPEKIELRKKEKRFGRKNNAEA